MHRDWRAVTILCLREAAQHLVRLFEWSRSWQRGGLSSLWVRCVHSIEKRGAETVIPELLTEQFRISL